MRGEKKDIGISNVFFSGSSPHARGKVSKILSIIYSSRIIPACAGKSLWVGETLKDVKDHPRMRGEKHGYRLEIWPVVGSSPHARGKEGGFTHANCLYRIIPACAGKRILLLKLLFVLQDHPRMRGEKLQSF